jgi:hypothetical protein
MKRRRKIEINLRSDFPNLIRRRNNWWQNRVIARKLFAPFQNGGVVY